MKDGEAKNRILEKICREMGPDIQALIEDPSVIEIMVNPDGKIWVERLSVGMRVCGFLPPSTTEALICSVASYLGEEVDGNSPILEAEFPIDKSRFEALLPPVVEGPTFALRKHAIKPRRLTDYLKDGSLKEHNAKKIAEAVMDRKNILIVGGTSSGKTTLANCILGMVSDFCPSDRVLVLEDTREIQSSSKNSVLLRTSSTVSMRELLRATLRLRPDRIVVGEVRGGEALDLLKAWTTGHPGGISTVHANNARAALYRLEQLSAEASDKPMNRLIAEAIDLIIVIQKTALGREVTEILELNGFDQQGYVLNYWE